MLIDNKNELIEGQETTIFQYLDNNMQRDSKTDKPGWITKSWVLKSWRSMK